MWRRGPLQASFSTLHGSFGCIVSPVQAGASPHDVSLSPPFHGIPTAAAPHTLRFPFKERPHCVKCSSTCRTLYVRTDGIFMAVDGSALWRWVQASYTSGVPSDEIVQTVLPSYHDASRFALPPSTFHSPFPTSRVRRAPTVMLR